jgi:thioredoxin-related protein
MHKFRFIFLVLIVQLVGVSSSIAQKKDKEAQNETIIKWYSFEEAYQLNKKKPKKVFVDVFTDWCGWCKKMDAETFANPVIAKYMQKHFYCVKLNAERKDTIVLDGVKFINPNPSSRRSTHQLANELLKDKMSYPSYVFLNDKGNYLTMVAGYQAAENFEIIIHYFGDDAYLKQTFEVYRTSFTGEIKK